MAGGAAGLGGQRRPGLRAPDPPAPRRPLPVHPIRWIRAGRGRGRGRAELDRGEHDRAVATTGEALALWRGTALADVPHGPTVSAERTRLEELRWSARQTLVDAR
ncbi:BTAD domain-containing putative transcriptional regulator, partial [Allokutzneria sp. NRRL B-24872]|uniref:BTAD domain-containing putative transcriptional regulator n=1 Tax=Allokutzneria sp. NRRL B-24872 TaxID=1137961 RepID=UPI00352F2AF4